MLKYGSLVGMLGVGICVCTTLLTGCVIPTVTVPYSRVA